MGFEGDMSPNFLLSFFGFAVLYSLAESSNTGWTDICPENGQGCPWDKVEWNFDWSTLSSQRCDVDDSCDSVMSEDGNAIGSGVSCRRSRRRGPKKIFCCRNPTPTQVSNLPRC